MDIFEKTKSASVEIALLDNEIKSKVLIDLANRLEASSQIMLEANAKDLAKMEASNPLYDRLKLDIKRLKGIADDMRHVATLPSPVGQIIEDRTLANGLRLRKVSVPFGVIGVVYEARPNVTFDVFSLCFKSGNACMLKGGKDADESNRAAVAIIKEVLRDNSLPQDAITLLEPTHEAVAQLLSAVGYVDLVIPRGGRKLIDFVRNNAKIPCIETGAGVVNAYFDKEGDLEIGKLVVKNAKTRRVSVCNALDCLIVHSGRLADLAQLVAPLAADNVTIYADERAFAALQGCYPVLEPAVPDSFGTEFMDYKMAIKTVDSAVQAMEHIAKYGSGHSESIITENPKTASDFQRRVDAACVYVNVPTSFTDGAQFGLGAEIGISTQKLGARGPMGLKELCSYKWLIDGHGQTRP